MHEVLTVILKSQIYSCDRTRLLSDLVGSVISASPTHPKRLTFCIHCAVNPDLKGNSIKATSITRNPAHVLNHLYLRA